MPGETRGSRLGTHTHWLAHPAFACALIAGVTLVLFWQTRNFDFITFDDPDYVTANPHVKAGLTWDGLVWAFGIGRVHNWHPLTWLSHMLDVQIFGAGAAAAHVVNVVFHIINSVLLFLLLRNATGAHWRSAFVAALFAWHPLHVESVAWISERKDVLSTLFWLLTLWAYGRFARGRLVKAQDSNTNETLPASDSRRSVFNHLLALLFFALGLMAKPMFVTLPFVLLFWDFWPLGRWKSEVQGSPFKVLGRLLVEKIPFFALSVASCVVTVLAQNKAIQSFTHFTLLSRIENVFVSYARYLGKMFWPVDLTLPYAPQPGHWHVALTIVAVALVIGSSIAALCLRRKLPFMITGWFWFVGTLVPVIGLVQVGIQSLADRYSYVPLIGAFIVVVWGGEFIFKRLSVPKYFAVTAASLVLIACAVKTDGQLSYWQNSEKLFRHAIAVQNENPVAHYCLGFYLFEKGRVEEAISHYRESVRLNGGNAEIFSDLGAALDQLGQTSEALENLNKSLQVAPDNWLAHYRLANVLTKLGRTDEAIDHYKLAVRHKPDFIEARNNLAVALFRASKPEEAIQQFREVVRYQPTNANAYFNLARSLAGTGRRAEAMTNLTEALRLQPDFAPARQFLESLKVER